MTNRLRKTAVALLLCLCFPASASAMTVREAVTLALENNPGHLGVEKAAQISALEIEKAKGRQLPLLELKGSYTRNSEPVTVHPIHQQGVFPMLDRDVYSGGLYMQMPLYAGGRYRASEELARHQHRASAQQQETSRQEIIFAVIRYYAEIVSLERLADAARRRVRFYREEKERVESMLAKGRLTRLDLAKISSRLSQASYELLGIENALFGNRVQLAALMNVDIERIGPLSGFVLPNTVLPGTLAEALERSGQSHPEMLRARALVDTSRSRVEIADSEWFPEVSAVGNARRMAGGDLTGQSEWQIGLQVNFPIFDGNVRSRNQQQARLEAERVALSMQGISSQLHASVTNAFQSVVTAEKSVEASGAALAEAEEALRIEKMRLQHGRSTVNDLTYAESAFWQASSSLTKAENELLISRAALLKAMGVLDVAHARTADPGKKSEGSGGETPAHAE